MRIKKPPYQSVQIYSPWCSNSKGEERIITLVIGRERAQTLSFSVGLILLWEMLSVLSLDNKEQFGIFKLIPAGKESICCRLDTESFWRTPRV